MDVGCNLSKGRPPRVWKSYEKEIILEHLSKNREKLGFTRDAYVGIRDAISGADSDALQKIVSDVYVNNSHRRSLLAFVSSSKNKGAEPNYAMLGVMPEVKSKFMRLKPDDVNVSAFLDLLLDCYASKN